MDGTNTEYYYNGSVLMYMITGSGSTAIQQRFSYDASGKLVAVVYKVGSGTSYIYYYLRNAQGDVVKLVDSSGNTVVEYTYDSWGKIIATTGSLANTVGANQPFRYRGYVYDEETGWYYLQSRYYDPTTCRFISADVLLSTGQGVIGHNSFAYCLNSPVAFRDPSGHTAFGILVHKAIQAYVIGSHICNTTWYAEVKVNRNRFGKGNIGWVDLVERNGGAYEIKPLKYYMFAITQLKNYRNAKLLEPERYPFKHLKTGHKRFIGTIIIGGKMVYFSCKGDGIIAYTVRDMIKSTAPEKNKSSVPVLVPATVPVPNYSTDRAYGNSNGLVFAGAFAMAYAFAYSMGGGCGLGSSFQTLR